jgi:hypothetical protein
MADEADEVFDHDGMRADLARIRGRLHDLEALRKDDHAGMRESLRIARDRLDGPPPADGDEGLLDADAEADA